MWSWSWVLCCRWWEEDVLEEVEELKVVGVAGDTMMRVPGCLGPPPLPRRYVWGGPDSLAVSASWPDSLAVSSAGLFPGVDPGDMGQGCWLDLPG